VSRLPKLHAAVAPASDGGRLGFGSIWFLDTMATRPRARRRRHHTPLTPNPFTLGVTSAGADHRSVVLSTRLVPDTLDPAMPAAAVAVQWEVYADERLRRPVARGLTDSRPADAHAVEVRVVALRSDRRYWFRFRYAGHVSPVGRTGTAATPAPVSAAWR
jgi:alkaline phosphatase D